MLATRIAAGATATLLGTTLLTGAPGGAATDPGLFGSQDPTYDGVYRQGLAITGLVAVKRSVPSPAIEWLLDQQCKNGAFTAYRPDTSLACAAPDPVNYTGQDTNSTALGAMALRAVGRFPEYQKAVGYLRKQQNPDGGFPWFAGGSSDSNSTGLVLAAFNGVAKSKGLRQQTQKAERFLAGAQLRCAEPVAERGLMAFDPSVARTPDALATAQVAIGTTTSLPAFRSGQKGAAMNCGPDGRLRSTKKVSAYALYALANTLRANGGLLPASSGGGSDISASAGAVIALAAAKYQPGVVSSSLSALKGQAKAYTENGTNPGATGTLLLTAGRTNSSPTSFGGVNLIRGLNSSMQ